PSLVVTVVPPCRLLYDNGAPSGSILGGQPAAVTVERGVSMPEPPAPDLPPTPSPVAGDAPLAGTELGPEGTELLSRARGLSAAEQLALVLADQGQRWERGQPIRVEAYLRALPELAANADSVLDLIYHEVVLWQEQGETPPRAEYLERFP